MMFGTKTFEKHEMKLVKAQRPMTSRQFIRIMTHTLHPPHTKKKCA
jgi:hypothetical protein